jgi:hypothetical protein
MAVHKVPQDVEADDKFLGPLSFKQFLFFGGFAICGYLTFLTLTKIWPLSFVFFIPMLLFGVLAFPWSKEQPTELFLASRIRFLIKPRKRTWDQSGVKDLVNITVPVREAHVYTDGLSQDEVTNRLGALASIVDSRGWAVKNVAPMTTPSDRLVEAAIKPDEKSMIIESTTDVFDDTSGTIAKQFDNMIEQAEQQHKSATLKLVEQAREKTSPIIVTNNAKTDKTTTKADPQNQDFWFLHQQAQPTDPSLATFQSSTVIKPGTTAHTSTTTTSGATDDTTTDISEEELLKTVHEKQQRDALQTMSRHEKVVDPSGQQKPKIKAVDYEPIKNETINTMTPPSNPDILNLAQSNDLSVETLSRQANKKKDFGDDEVVISLH